MNEMTPLEQRMASGNRFTYGELCSRFDRDHTEFKTRAIDRTIQKWRKRGLIDKKREGKFVFWSLTDKGKEAFSHDRSV